ncbi:MAG: hypothetical protein HN909_06045 [Phycisphaerales bacterium]|jgi:hypothetical protein|nr:hypothetical protein [Phycisphaerales bacterium]MBT7171314.1 hypothetical protein [Phycisphaerales bacterium]
MSEPTERKPLSPKAKLAFVAIFLVAGFFIYQSQNKNFSLKGWTKITDGSDLPAVFAQAKSEGRKIAAFFLNSPPSETARTVARRIWKAQNQKALKRGNFIPVLVYLRGTSDSLAKRYDIKNLPTFVVFLPDGTERNREVGSLGEVPFRANFLQAVEE